MFVSLQPTKKYFVVMFLISCFLLEIFTLVSYRQTEVNNRATDQTVRIYEDLHAAHVVVVDASKLAQAEHVLAVSSRSATALADYQQTRERLRRETANLFQTEFNTQEQRRDIAYLHEKIDELVQRCDAYFDAIKSDTLNPIVRGKFDESMRQGLTEVRDVHENFVNDTRAELEKHIALTKNAQRYHLWTVIAGGVLGFCALLISNLVILSLIGRNTRAEENLRKSEGLFAIILNEINEGVFDQRVQENTIYYSPSYKAMLGYGEKELGTTLADFRALVHPDDVASSDEMYARYINHTTNTYHNVFRLKHKDGHWLWIMSRGVGIWDDKGTIQRLMGTHTDVTAQKRREEELNYFMLENERQRDELALAKEKAEAASRAKSDFLATMSHEIRTPMNAVIGLASLLLEMRLPPKQREMMETLHANADILLQLVNDLLDISRIESGQIELDSQSFSFDNIFKTLNALFDGQAAAKGTKLHLTNQLGAQQYLGDATRLQQILVNLISNALKFTQRGSISVTASGSRDEGGTTHLSISVADTGVGIPPEKLAVIFDKFVQADQTISRRYGGSGLGLAISKSLANLMGGDVSVISSVNQGSVFTLSLPLHETKSQVPHPPVPIYKAAAASTGKVLVVEDYAANVMVATLVLENLGYETDVATSGAEALLLVRERITPYTAILMDVQMHGMDGYETTRRLRALEKEKGMRHFVIGVTAHALAGDRDKCLEAGMDDYMSKPINHDLLAEKLSHVLAA
jgi:PAS domain S-box-containing protein